MKESGIIKRILLKLSPMARLFRNNTGMGWQGRVTDNKNGRMVIQGPRPLRAGLIEGSSDIIGWTPINVTPEMVGRKIAVFTAIEVKTGKQTATAKQKNFLNRVYADGGMAGIAFTPEEAEAIIQRFKTNT